MRKSFKKITAFAVSLFIGAGISVFAYDQLIPLGIPIGIKLYSDGIIVAGLSDVQTKEREYSPIGDAGVKAGDIIIKIDGNSVRTTEELEKVLDSSQGDAITLDVIRNGTRKTLSLTPALSAEDGKWHIGAWVRDSMAGIGTVSFVDPETGDYGALGHAICDIDSGQIIPLYSGSIMTATVTDVKKGQAGTPGELHGSFDITRDIGTINKNTEKGIFGQITDSNAYLGQKAYTIGDRNDIHEGDITVVCTVEGNQPREYKAEITKIYGDRTNTEKNMLIKITDENLLEKTGGIVQGMSGSPIIQDDRIIGAITHVLVNDPQKGYGIFIENMLDEIKTANSLDNAA